MAQCEVCGCNLITGRKYCWRHKNLRLKEREKADNQKGIFCGWDISGLFPKPKGFSWKKHLAQGTLSEKSKDDFNRIMGSQTKGFFKYVFGDD